MTGTAPDAAGCDAGGLGPESSRSVWQRSITAWHVAFWFGLALAMVNAVINPQIEPGTRPLLAGLLVVLGVGYLIGVMRPIATGRYRETPGYIMLAIVVVGLCCALEPSMALLLTVVFPQVWMFSPGPYWGIVGSVALTTSFVLGFAYHVEWDSQILREMVPQVILSLGFSIGLGVWIHRVIAQSRQRAELIDQLERTRNELNQAHHERGMLAERERVAREIHDTLAQGFAGVVMLVQGARARAESAAQVDTPLLDKLDLIETVARENLAEARALVAAHSPIDLDGATLTDAIRRVADRTAERTGTQVDVEILGTALTVTRDQEVALLRVTQEALANVGRHARASRAVVRLSYTSEHVVVEVIDNGVGFDPDHRRDEGSRDDGGFGLAGVRARIHEAGGTVEVHSTPGQGCRLVAQIPVLATDQPTIRSEADAPDHATPTMTTTPTTDPTPAGQGPR